MQTHHGTLPAETPVLGTVLVTRPEDGIDLLVREKVVRRALFYIGVPSFRTELEALS